MTTTIPNILTLKNYIGNELVDSSGTTFTSVSNPSLGIEIARTPNSKALDVDRAVAVALNAFKTWRNVPAPGRAAIFFKYKELLELHFEEICHLITLENGKTLPEAQGDLRRGIEVVEFACATPHTLKGEKLQQIATHMDGVTTREPIGVCAGITPYNFPAMVPMWMFPLSIVCGNTFILKPSEKVPFTAMRLAELLVEAGLPVGVLNLVHGGREVVERICEHPDIAAVSFVGSTSVAEIVYQKSCHHGKRVQAAGGAKNVMVVMPDADLDSTVRAIIGASFGCAGQRCMAGSTVIAVGNVADELQTRLSLAIDAMNVQATVENPKSDMGPVIDSNSRDRLLKDIQEAGSEGATIVRNGQSKLPSEGFFVSPALLDNVTIEMSVAKKELFGPILCMGRTQTLEEALYWINSIAYGNGSVIFTKDGSAARHFEREVQCGMVGINVGVPAPMAIFSFSGWNKSFFGDLHVQGMEGLLFYTRQKVTFSRWDNNYIRKQGW